MKLTRRKFLGWLGAGSVGVLSAVHAPKWLVDECAMERLRRAYNKALVNSAVHIRRIDIGGKLYNQLESELSSCMRFSLASESLPSEPTLKFKGATIHRSAHNTWIIYSMVYQQ